MSEMTLESAWRYISGLQLYFSEMYRTQIVSSYLTRTRVFRRRLFITCLAVILACFISPRLRASIDSSETEPVLTIAQYEAELDRLSSAVSRLADHPDEIRGLRESLPSGWVVAVEGAQSEISCEWIAGSLKDMEENLSERKKRSEELGGQIQKMRSEAERLPGTLQTVDEAGAREKLQRILSGREFQSVRSQSWLSRVWNQVGQWIEWVLDHTIGRLVESGPARTLILWTLIIGVLLAIAIWVVRILTRMARTEALRVEGVFPPGRNWRDWAHQALSDARGGDYRSALHSAYWAGVYKLGDLGAWQIDSARTPREYLRLLSNHPAAKVSFPAPEMHPTVGRLAALTSLTRSMEAVWYGYSPATQKDFEAAIENLETLGCKLGSTAQTANS
jgi:hypothetical protein